MRISTSLAFQRATSAMTEQQSQLSKTEMQMATGLKHLTAADDPPAAARILGLNQAIGSVTQYQENIERLSSRLEYEEAAVDNTVNILQRINELAIAGNNGNLLPSDTQAIASELHQLLDEMLGMANTQDSNGEYIFAGFQSDTPPFSRPAIDTFAYSGDQGQRSLQISAGRQVADGDNGFDMFVNVDTGPFATVTEVAATTFGALNDGDLTINGIGLGYIPPAADADERASQIFDAVNAIEDITHVQALMDSSSTLTFTSSAGDIDIYAASLADTGLTTAVETATTEKRSILESVYQLADALDNNDAVDRYINDIQLALEHITMRQTTIGGRLNAVFGQSEVNASVKLIYEADLSSERDLDYTEAIGRFNQQTLALQAAQQAFVKIQGLSLFNYI